MFLRSIEKLTVLRNKLIMHVAIRAIASTQNGKSLEGIESERWVKLSELKIKFLISLIEGY